jgi:hypothetical protein
MFSIEMKKGGVGIPCCAQTLQIPLPPYKNASFTAMLLPSLA